MISHWKWTKELILKATEEEKITWESFPRERLQSGYEAWLTGFPKALSDVQITLAHNISSILTSRWFREKMVTHESWQLEIIVTGIGVRSFTTDMDVYPESQEKISEAEMQAFNDELLTIRDRKRDPVFSNLAKFI